MEWKLILIPTHKKIDKKIWSENITVEAIEFWSIDTIY